MKRSITIGILAFLYLSGMGQEKKPIAWKVITEHYIKKGDDQFFIVHLKATLQEGWHIYACEQPRGHICVPTSIKIESTDPLLHPIIANGSMDVGGNRLSGGPVIWEDEKTGISAAYFQDTVDFKRFVKRRISGEPTPLKITVTYQVCTDEVCLPPKTEDFYAELK